MRCVVLFVWVVALLLPLVAISGCGPEVSRSDLGTILDQTPQLPGTDEPYALPKVGNVSPEAAAKRFGARPPSPPRPPYMPIQKGADLPQP